MALPYTFLSSFFYLFIFLSSKEDAKESSYRTPKPENRDPAEAGEKKKKKPFPFPAPRRLRQPHTCGERPAAPGAGPRPGAGPGCGTARHGSSPGPGTPGDPFVPEPLPSQPDPDRFKQQWVIFLSLCCSTVRMAVIKESKQTKNSTVFCADPPGC